MRKGIVLAGGSGTRLKPLTTSVNKQLLPVYDKPLIFYPISTLMSAGVKDILIIVGSEVSKELFIRLLGTGEDWGVNFSYAIQDEPRGLADAFLVGEEFIGEDSVVLALGDNIFYGQYLEKVMTEIKDDENVIFGYQVRNPQDYGVAWFESYGEHKLERVIEKPTFFVSNWAVPGLYFYDNTVIEKAKKISSSDRGELEIVDIHNQYIKEERLKLIKLDFGTVWFDTGNPDHLLEAGNFVKAIQNRVNTKIGSPLHVAMSKGW